MLLAIALCAVFTLLLFVVILYIGKLETAVDKKCNSLGQATVISVSQVDPSPDNMIRLALVLKIDPEVEPKEAFFTGRILQNIQILHASRFTPGATLPVRFDSSNHKNIRFRF
jgi:hypothetical protein